MNMEKRTSWNEWSKELLHVLAWLIGLVFALHVGGQLMGWAVGVDNRVVTDIAARLSVDSELSVPTWVSAFLALVAALFAVVIARAQTARQPRTVWYGLALVMTLVSLDEVAALHELLLQGLHILVNFSEQQSLLSNAWLILLPFIVVAGAVAMRLTKRHLPAATFGRFCTAAAIYLSGALVVEYLSAPADKSHLAYLLGVVMIEEGLEYFGLWLVIRAGLLHISEHEPELKQKIEALIAP